MHPPRRVYSAGQRVTTKSRRERRVPITEQLKPILVKHAFGRAPHEPLLRGPGGTRINHSTFRNKVDWVWLVKDMGWPGLRFHDLRGSAIVMWIRARVPLHVVREMAGHGSLKTTDIYVRLARNELSEAAEMINSAADPYTAPYSSATR